jgi:DnaJ-class molecular chaperone
VLSDEKLRKQYDDYGKEGAMPNTGFGMTRDLDHSLRQELTAIQRTLRKCSTRFLVVTPLKTGKQHNTDSIRVSFH